MEKIRNTQIKPRMASMWLSCSSRGIHATTQFVPFIHSFRCCLLGKNSNKKHFSIDHTYNFTHIVLSICSKNYLACVVLFLWGQQSINNLILTVITCHRTESLRYNFLSALVCGKSENEEINWQCVTVNVPLVMSSSRGGTFNKTSYVHDLKEWTIT